MAGIEKGVTLRHIAKVLYGAFKGESITRPVLGRFGKIDCEDSAKQKSELANEDHCGTCATYVLQKQEELGDKNKSIPVIPFIDVDAKNKAELLKLLDDKIEEERHKEEQGYVEDNNNDDDDDDDDDNHSPPGLGMVVGNNTVFVGKHTVQPQRDYVLAFYKGFGSIEEDDLNSEIINRMLFADMYMATPVLNSDYNMPKRQHQDFVYYV